MPEPKQPEPSPEQAQTPSPEDKAKDLAPEDLDRVSGGYTASKTRPSAGQKIN